MFNRRKKKSLFSRIVSFLITWCILSWIFPLDKIVSVLSIAGISLLVAFLVGKTVGKAEQSREGQNQAGQYSGTGRTQENNPAAGTKYASERTGNPSAAAQRAAEQKAAAEKKQAEREQSAAQRASERDRNGSSTSSNTTASSYTAGQSPEDDPLKNAAKRKKSYGPEIDPLVQEGNRALSEMGRLYMSIKDPEIRAKINEIMRITDKITQDAIDDPSDIPQIKKFFRYYLPTTIKLLNSYDRMASQGIEGENIDRSMKNISEMLDVAIAAYKKRLDSLFEDQALDIETDIDVMNQMLAREGLAGDREFIQNQTRKKNSGTTAGTDAADNGATDTGMIDTGVTGTATATQTQYGTAVQAAASEEMKG